MSVKEGIMRMSERHPFLLSCVPAWTRIGFGYSGYLKSIARGEILDHQEMEELLLAKLRDLLMHSFKNVEFYREFYRQKEFEPSDLRSLKDWELVPIVKKEDFQDFSLERRCVRGDVDMPANTGGTSGAPLAFMLPKNAVMVEWAHMHSIWKARGYRMSQLKLRLGGTYLDDDEPVRFHPRHNEYIVNANCPMVRVVEAVVRLSKNQIFRWIHGYPSLVAEFAHAFSERAGESADTLRDHLYGILLGSEYPAPVYRDPIERILSSNIVSWYGHSEMAVLAGETAKGIYRSLPTYGYAEAVPLGATSAHRLVCTSLHNYSHPFIRYDTGDMIQPVSRSGGSLTFKIKEGRVGDFVVDRCNRKLALTSIIFGRHHTAFGDLLHLQVRQDSPGKITMLIVPRSADFDAAAMKSGFDFTGLDIEWGLERIDAPVRTIGGKIKLKVDF